MREIKFRAWSDKLKMSNPFTLKDAVNSDIDEFEVYMEYTGLKDKNGSEIYEGDLLKLDDWEEIQIVKFENGKFCLFSTREKYTDYTTDIKYIYFNGEPRATITGNIYEGGMKS